MRRPLDAKPTDHPQQVNRAVAFNAIKHQALALLCSETDIETLCAELTALFLTSPCSQRPSRPRAGRPQTAACTTTNDGARNTATEPLRPT